MEKRELLACLKNRIYVANKKIDLKSNSFKHQDT